MLAGMAMKEVCSSSAALDIVLAEYDDRSLSVADIHALVLYTTKYSAAFVCRLSCC